MIQKLINPSFFKALSVSDKDKVESILKDKRYDISEYEAMMVAIEYNHKFIVHLLLDNTSIDKVKLLEVLNIIVIVKPGWIDVIKRLFDFGVEIEKQNESGDTVIHVAFNNVTSHGIIDILLKRYLEKNTENLMNSKGISLLHIACTRTNLVVVKKLLDANPHAMLNAPGAVSLYTPLHYSVQFNRHEIARYLIKRGADIYKVDWNRSTPLHWALSHHDAPMIDLIISMDCRRENIVNNYGLSHFIAACAGSNENIVEDYLQALLDHPNFCIHDLITSKIPKFSYFTGYTPLHVAVRFGCVTAVELLLRYGADCCTVAEDRLTPHLLAQSRGHGHMKRLLQEHCDLMKKCRVTRAKDPDFRKWGEEYEEHTVLERVKTLKHLCEIYKNLSSNQRSDKIFVRLESCQDEFISTDFPNGLQYLVN